MSKKLNDLAARVKQLISLADKTLSTQKETFGNFPITYVDEELFISFRTAVLSFIGNLYGEKHSYFVTFVNEVVSARPSYVRKGRGILSSIKTELDEGWLNTVKGLISAEIFSNFIEMAEHLLEEKYKDPAAVMIGSVLEEHLRQLCLKNNIPTTTDKDNKTIPKKADTMNSELANKGIYNKLDQKSVTAWLDLRNKAAHGKYTEYNQSQVQLMLQSVTDFIARNDI